MSLSITGSAVFVEPRVYVVQLFHAHSVPLAESPATGRYGRVQRANERSRRRKALGI